MSKKKTVTKDGWTSMPILTPSSLFTTLKHEATKEECRNFHVGKFDRDGKLLLRLKLILFSAIMFCRRCTPF